MQRLHQILTLDLLPQLGVYRLMQRLSGLDAFQLFNLTDIQLKGLGFSASQISLIQHPPINKLTAIEHWLAQQPNRYVISYFDDHYPPLLKEISSPPLLLFCQGNIGLMHAPQVAMVGSRAATVSGKETAKRLAYELAAHGLCVTSGLAAGIDSCAHRGALNAQGATIAVMGCGLNTIYPKSNVSLANEIISHGLLISEFWPDVTPKASQFPRRNRIVSGLSLGVVVVEAADKSGSLITARLAAEQNREVFAVPGSVNNPKVAGCHKLINQGAKLITNVADILEELTHYSLVRGIENTEEVSQDNIHTYSDPESSVDPVLVNIGFDTTAVDVIAQRCNLTIEQVLERLLMLELSGHVSSQPGGYIRIKRAI